MHTFLQKFLRVLILPLNQRGDTAVTALVGAAFVALAAGGTGAILKMMRKEAGYSAVNSASLAAESSILLALQNPDFYTKEMASLMRAGGENVIKGVKILGEGGGAVAELGGSVALDAAGAPCVGTSEKPCAMTTHVQIDCAGGGCKAAYQIEFSPPPGARAVASEGDGALRATMPPLGAAHWPPVAGSTDFSIVISYDNFRREDGKNVCAPGELFVSGLDKSNGNVACVLPSQIALAPNQIGEGMAYNPATRSLEYTPRTLQKFACPEKYVLRSIDPRSLDQGRSVQGTCVYRYKKEVPWMEEWPAGQASVSGPFCPQEDYGVVPDGDCTMNVISRSKGLCPRTCCDGQGHCSDCSYEVDPVISYRLEKSFDSRGPNVSCALVKTGSQPCGASWEGEVRWGGRCKIYVPEHLPAVGK